MDIEDPSRIEPAFIEDRMPTELADLAIEIKDAAAGLGKGLPAASMRELRKFVAIMNSYYSNLIEGHHTRPADIEKALAENEQREDRPLLVEARVHVLVQDRIDEIYLSGKSENPVSPDFIRDIHKRFYEELPESLRIVTREGREDRHVEPGCFRKVEADDVKVGIHIPPSSDRVLSFMQHFHERYAMAIRSPINKIVSIPAAHHRFTYIHPFLDGNGRVGRLMSHAMCHHAGIAAGGLWSISRGLARGLNDRQEYKEKLARADMPRQGERDGRGNLSMAMLREFSEWFLAVMLDQIKFTSVMFDFERLNDRLPVLAGDIVGSDRSSRIMSAVLKHGTVARGDIAYLIAAGGKRVTGRTIQSDLRALTAAGFLRSDTPKGPVCVSFPIQFRERLFPNLFTDTEIAPPPIPKLDLERS